MKQAGGRDSERRRADAELESDRMTEGQRSYLIQLCDETGESFDEGMNIAEASHRIHELEQQTGRASH